MPISILTSYGISPFDIVNGYIRSFTNNDPNYRYHV